MPEYRWLYEETKLEVEVMVAESQIRYYERQLYNNRTFYYARQWNYQPNSDYLYWQKQADELREKALRAQGALKNMRRERRERAVHQCTWFGIGAAYSAELIVLLILLGLFTGNHEFFSMIGLFGPVLGVCGGLWLMLKVEQDD